MYLAEVSLINIRCFEKSHLSFIDDDGKPIMWTVIFGENGTGKSTILRLIAILLTDRYAMMELTDGQPRRLLRYQTREGVAEARVRLDKKSKKSKKIIEIGLHFHDAPGERGFKERATSDRITFSDEMLFLAGYGETRIPSNIPSSESTTSWTDQRGNHLLSLFQEGVPLRLLDDWLWKLDYQDMKSRKKRENRFRGAINALTRILPNAPEFVEMTEKGEPLFDTPYGIVPLNQLSSGYRDVSYFLMDIVSRLFDAFPSSENPLRESGIVLIDELSLHLHPKWQQEIVGRLRKHLPNIQFIATTHSPLVAQSLEKNELVTLKMLKRRRKKATVEIRRLDYSPKAMSTDQLLTSSIFGLESAKSIEIGMKRKKLATLRNKIVHETASPKEEKEYQEIVDALEQLGEAPGDTDREREFYVLVEKLLSEMGENDLLERPSLQQLKKLSEKK
jgi:hypothetical protein